MISLNDGKGQGQGQDRWKSKGKATAGELRPGKANQKEFLGPGQKQVHRKTIGKPVSLCNS